MQQQLEMMDKTIAAKYEDAEDFDIKMNRVDDEIKAL